MSVDIERLRELLANRKPWIADGSNRIKVEDAGGMRVGMYPLVANFYRPDDRDLAVALHAAAPALLDELERFSALKALIDEYGFAVTKPHPETGVRSIAHPWYIVGLATADEVIDAALSRQKEGQ